MLFSLTNTAAEAVTTAAETAAAGVPVEPFNFISNLSYMGLGMLGIFIVMGAIILSTALLNKIFSGKKK